MIVYEFYFSLKYLYVYTFTKLLKVSYKPFFKNRSTDQFIVLSCKGHTKHILTILSLSFSVR